VIASRRAFGNVAAVAALVIVAMLQITSVHFPPLARVLHAVPLAATDWLIVIAASLIPAVAGQFLKLARHEEG
jgi:magnesium-transporting ATPase (P-type)